jgi:hypothetical protein
MNIKQIWRKLMGEVVQLRRGTPKDVVESLLKDIDIVHSIVCIVTAKAEDGQSGSVLVLNSDQEEGDIVYASKVLDAQIVREMIEGEQR